MRPSNANYLSPSFLSSLVGTSTSQVAHRTQSHFPVVPNSLQEHTLLADTLSLTPLQDWYITLFLCSIHHTQTLFFSPILTQAALGLPILNLKKNILGTNPDMRNFSQTYKARRTALRTRSCHPSSFKNTLIGLAIPVLPLTSF